MFIFEGCSRFKQDFIMNIKRIFNLFILCWLISDIGSAQEIKAVNWLDLETAISKQEKDPKPLFIDV
ncbi:MAG TPA: hypothetical protein EYQ86_08615, partial [Bacteroidetes bacterium]|nr:hypothetical protein [Bacteroidota bacterium]